MANAVLLSKVRLWIKLGLKTALAVPGLLLKSRQPYVRVLFYHRINPYTFHDLGAVSRELTVQPDMFEAQMRYLARNNYRTLKLEEFCRMMAGTQAIDAKAVLITFDDGYEDNLLWAAPLLAQFGFSAVVFIVSDFIGKSTADVWPNSDPTALGMFFNEAQISDWKRAGFEIGSHTKTHPLLTTLPVEQQLDELSASKNALEVRFGDPIQSIAYPGGDFDQVTAGCVFEAGYSLAFTTIPGVNRPSHSMMSICRTEVSASDSMLVFRAKIAGVLDWLAFKESHTFRQFMARLNRLLIPLAQSKQANND